MSYGAGFAVGIGAGLGTGIAIGVATGKKKAREEILAHSTTRAMTVRSGGGEEIPMEQFLDEALGSEKKANPTAIVLLIVGLIAMLGVAVFLMVTRGG
jgi:hypothetical protein